MTHTPGPYRVDGVHLVDDLADEPLPHAVIRDSNERWVALVEITDLEGEANAALIAAAPAMYEALKNLLDYAVDPAQFTRQNVIAFIDKGTEAIRLAEGRA